MMRLLRAAVIGVILLLPYLVMVVVLRRRRVKVVVSVREGIWARRKGRMIRFGWRSVVCEKEGGG